MTEDRLESFYARYGKRWLDTALAVCGLILLLPLMSIIGVAIYIFSGRPVVFAQTRVGLGGRHFRILKFRTMVLGAEQAGTATVAHDFRITSIGRVLRRWKLDEVLQLWNVLIGEMSFVGPRADVPEVMNLLSGKERVLLRLRPGITGPATLMFHDEERILWQQPDPEQFSRETLFPAKVKLNLKYVEQISLLTDLSYVGKTVSLILAHPKPMAPDGYARTGVLTGQKGPDQ
jgi:lipopolysaccharide/colanic/teichoic acid biosynthesis glycosyltransferase